MSINAMRAVASAVPSVVIQDVDVGPLDED